MPSIAAPKLKSKLAFGPSKQNFGVGKKHAASVLKGGETIF